MSKKKSPRPSHETLGRTRHDSCRGAGIAHAAFLAHVLIHNGSMCGSALATSDVIRHELQVHPRVSDASPRWCAWHPAEPNHEYRRATPASQRLFVIPDEVIVRGDLTIENGDGGGPSERIDLVSAEGAGDVIR